MILLTSDGWIRTMPTLNQRAEPNPTNPATMINPKPANAKAYRGREMADQNR